MTVHQAKGLQAPVVFLADPYSGHDPQPSDHAGRDDGGWPYATVPLIRPYAHGGFSLVAAPRCWHERDAEEAALYDAAEDRRIVYVAATRARGLLVVSRYLPKEGAGTWGLLDAGLDGAQPLEALLAGPAEPPPSPHHPLDSGRERRCEALARASRPSFVARTVSENTGEGRATTAYEGTDEAGYGSAYGTAVHQLFEWAVRSRGDGPQPAAERALVERLWAEHDVQTPFEYALEALAALRASELWHRVLSADEVHAEVPVAGRLPTAAAGGGGSTPTEPVIWRGTVDLAYRDDAGWHLVDYKTDGDAVAEALADCAARHAEQLAVYAALWEAASGAAPASRSLWFTASGALYSV
jgi:ATP-dependent helicase/nuclease subunit A